MEKRRKLKGRIPIDGGVNSGRRSEVSESEVRKSEAQKSEVRGQKTEVRDQRTEGKKGRHGERETGRRCLVLK